MVVAALCGIAKTTLPGAATIAVALSTAVLPAKESTGAILLMLMTGDLLAVWSYRRDADFRMLRRLVPAVLAGVGAGALFLHQRLYPSPHRRHPADPGRRHSASATLGEQERTRRRI